MKTTTILIIFLLAGFGLQAQEISFGYAHTSAISTQFKKPVGLYVGYSKSINQKIKINVDVLSNYSYQYYDLIFHNDADPGKYFAYKVNPDNLWLSLSSSLTFRSFSRGCLTFFMGPQVSLNYFFCNEKIHSIPTVYNSESTHQDKKHFLNKLGVGWNFEFELKGIFGKKISIISSFTPQIITYDFYVMGGHTDWFILANISRIGLRYSFNNQPDTK